jgi:hypothetical protein
MEMSATLRVTRRTGFGIELRRGTFEISVDGQSVGSLENQETVETSLEPGRHSLQMRKGRYSSRTCQRRSKTDPFPPVEN